MTATKKPSSQPRQRAKSLIDASAIPAIVDWLTGDDSHDLEAPELVAQLGSRLRRAGIALDRLVVHLRTIHPELLGSTLAWTPQGETQVYERLHGFEQSVTVAPIPLLKMLEAREPIVVRLREPEAQIWTQVDVFKDPDLVEFIFFVLRNARGPVASAFFCTKRESGFSAADVAALKQIIPALRNACELRGLLSSVMTMLDTYVGTGTAQRILSGHIRRGQVESLDAALLLCDLRGFTQMSNRLPSQRVLELLDVYFDCVVPAITAAGGEVLKFMGDAVLAFFHREEAAQACSAALEGALSALQRLEQFSATGSELHAGIALHYGKVSYGNIGSGHRLDFTLIGPDVNLLARIQTVCSTTGQPLLMSERFAQLLGPARSIATGDHDLKGFANPVTLYGLAP
jgi:adenylate cyclase